MTKVKIAHASKDENGNIKGGKAGDQTGKEVCIRDWYNRPWNVVIRFKDATMRERVAYAMERAANNPHIGYDQWQRNTALTYARYVEYDPGRITQNCETDCSALVSLACMYAGVPESALFKDGNSSTTKTLKARLRGTGLVDVFTGKKYTQSSTLLMRGDILLYEGHHTAVVVEGNEVPDIAPQTTERPYTAQADIETTWTFLKSKIGNAYGVAGLMGNLKAESALIPINLQNSANKRLGMTDEEYTKAVDNGTYTNFVKDAAGYGIAQWTYHTRKSGLLDYAKAINSSVGNLTTQLEFLIKELNGSYKGVMHALMTATSVRDASDIVLTQFERPANQSEGVKTSRAQYGQEIYDMFVKKSVSDIAKEVIHGLWGSGNDRKTRLTAAGYNYNEVQTEVNRLLRG